MKEIQLKELQRSINYMTAIGCTFKIITPEGEEFGTLEVVVHKPRTRAPLRHRFGAISDWYKPQINLDAEIGDVQVIKFGGFLMDEVRSGVCSMLSKRWGKDTYTTNILADSMEVLRTDKKETT
jgi:hypothetical protein